jgi:hypothetical protein
MTNYVVLQINYKEDIIRNRIKKLRQTLKLVHLDKDIKVYVKNITWYFIYQDTYKPLSFP